MIIIEVLNEEKYVCLHLIGSVDSNGAPDLDVALSGVYNQGKPLVIDVESVKYVSSAGLRVFLDYQKKMKAIKSKLLLCNLNGNVQEVFDISGFSSIFQIYDTRENAIAKL